MLVFVVFLSELYLDRSFTLCDSQVVKVWEKVEWSVKWNKSSRLLFSSCKYAAASRRERQFVCFLLDAMT